MSAGHVHCPCNSCKGKAVNRRTQISHIRMQKEIENLSTFERDTSDVHQNRAINVAQVEMNFEGKFSQKHKCVCVSSDSAYGGIKG